MFAKTQKPSSLTAQHTPSLARDALLSTQVHRASAAQLSARFKPTVIPQFLAQTTQISKHGGRLQKSKASCARDGAGRAVMDDEQRLYDLLPPAVQTSTPQTTTARF